MIDWPQIVVALGTIGAFGIAFATFWIKFGTRLSKAESDATVGREASEKVGLLSAAFSLYREQVAREYIHREVMREVEERMTAAIDRLADRLDRVLERAERPRAHD